MAKIQFEQDRDGVYFVDGRKRFNVVSEAAVDLLYGPLLGLRSMGIYHLIIAYTGHNDDWRGMGILKLAKLYHIGSRTWIHDCRMLEKVGLIDIKVPHEEDRKKGISTVYVVVDVPEFIPVELLDELTDGHGAEYQSGAPWWLLRHRYSDAEDQVDDPVIDDFEPDEGGMVNGQYPYGQTEIPVWSDENLRTDSLPDSLDSKDCPDFPERKIAGLDPVASAASQGEQPSTDTSPLTGKDEGATPDDPPAEAVSKTPRKHKVESVEELQQQANRRQARVAGSTTGNFEERIPPGSKASKAIRVDDKRFPAVGSLVIDFVAENGGNYKRELTQQQIDDLTTIPVRTSGGQELQFTVAGLYEQHPVEFKAWLKTLPAVFRDHKKRFTITNTIEYLRGYTWQNVGFEAYLNSRNIFPGRQGPQRPAAEQPQQPEYGSYDEYRNRFKEKKD